MQQILVRHSEQRERARALLEQVKRDSSTPTSPTKVSIRYINVAIALV